MAGKRNTRLKTIGDVSKFLAKLINQVQRKEIEDSTASKLAYISNILIGALRDSEIERRIEALEELQNNKPKY